MTAKQKRDRHRGDKNRFDPLEKRQQDIRIDHIQYRPEEIKLVQKTLKPNTRYRKAGQIAVVIVRVRIEIGSAIAERLVAQNCRADQHGKQQDISPSANCPILFSSALLSAGRSSPGHRPHRANPPAPYASEDERGSQIDQRVQQAGDDCPSGQHGCGSDQRVQPVKKIAFQRGLPQINRLHKQVHEQTKKSDLADFP